MKTGTIIVWFRNDLRLHDNEVITKAIANSDKIIPIYCIDPRQFKLTAFGTRKTGAFRARFLLDSLAELRKAIHKLGGKLIIELGEPEQIIVELAQKYKAKAVYALKEITHEEIEIENNLEKALWKQHIPLDLIWGNTLYHVDDIPFTTKDIPDIFTQFKKRVESESVVKPLFPTPLQINILDDIEESPIPDLRKLGLVLEHTTIFKGGEQNAFDRLNHYFWQTNLIKSYKLTRNGLLGLDYSSKFSPWLANGCISPRFIYHQVKKVETERGANDSTYWLIYELLWRDYFKFIFKKYGNRFFSENGIKSKASISYRPSNTALNKWKTGKTDEPFVNANMLELAQTGFMSNRGRQNVASYLVHDLKVNWLEGAAYFEEMLIDYDVCSNYGNWAYIAGVGNDPRENRKFNIEKQAKDYDPEGKYVKFWIPESEKRKQTDLV